MSEKSIVKNEDFYEDEIDLIEIIKTIWNRKYVIFTGVLLITLAAGFFYFLKDKIYKVESIISPGIINIASDGRQTFVETPENIKSIIESGSLNSFIFDEFNKDKGIQPLNSPEDIKFKVNIFNKTNTIIVSVETADIEKAKKLLFILNSKLIDKYSQIKNLYVKKAESAVQKIDKEISDIEKLILDSKNDIVIFKNDNLLALNNMDNEIKELKEQKKSFEFKKKRMEAYILNQKDEIATVKRNTDVLIVERNRLLENKSVDEKSLSLMMYLNLIQQNLSLMNTMGTSLNESYRSFSEVNMELSAIDKKIEDLRNIKIQKKKNNEIEIDKRENGIEKIKFEIVSRVKNRDEIKAQMSIISNIQILQPPIVRKSAVGPDIRMVVLLSGFGALFIMAFAVLFREYIKNNW